MKLPKADEPRKHFFIQMCCDLKAPQHLFLPTLPSPFLLPSILHPVKKEQKYPELVFVELP